ncbi:MAG: pentapeptide repeat-containing protein [Cyanobacteria bacterium J06639_14]
MAATVRASTTGLQRVDKARRKKGWTKAEQAWADLALTSPATLKRFWAGVSIGSEAFREICKAVKINDWEAIIDFEADAKPSSEICGQRLSFAIAGSIEKIDKSKLDAIVALLRTLGGDTTIEILDMDEGSLKLILGGSQKALERIQSLFESGELTEVAESLIQDIHFLDKSELIELIKKNGGSALNLTRVDLSEADLSEVDLSKADLSKANLSRANLSQANLSRANLSFSSPSFSVNVANVPELASVLDFNRANNRYEDLIYILKLTRNLANILDYENPASNLRPIGPKFAQILDRALLPDLELTQTLENMDETDLDDACTTALTIHRDLETALNLALDSAINLAKVSDIINARIHVGYLINDITRAFDLSFTLIKCLSGANFYRAELYGICLDDACVQNAIFTEARGLSIDMEQSLRERGAFFKDRPEDRISLLSPIPVKR